MSPVSTLPLSQSTPSPADLGSPLVAFTPRQSAALFLAYSEHLSRRNGSVDLERRQSSTRDAFFAEIAGRTSSVASAADQATFAAAQVPGQLGNEHDERTLWAVCAANINLAEAFGVDLAIAHQGVANATDPVERAYQVILVEENYHTRLLRLAIGAMGLTMQVHRPTWWIRAVVGTFTRLPRPVSDFMTFCSELNGIAAFRLLHERAQTLFANEPDVLRSINDVFSEILIDEIGHVHFLRARLSPLLLRVAGWVSGPLMEIYLCGVPEMKRLFGRPALHAALAKVISGESLKMPGGGVHPALVATAA